MSEHVTGTHRKQSVLFPDTLDEYVDKENPVRFIDAFIDSLNLEKLGFKHSVLQILEDHRIIPQTCSSSMCTATSTRSGQAENSRENATATLRSCG